MSANSADRMIMWVRCADVVSLSDTQLDMWKSRGVGGFACSVGHLSGMGGDQDYTGDPNAAHTGDNFANQRTFRDTNIVGRAKSRGMKMYLGVYLTNYFNTKTPLREWSDDRGWSQLVVPKARDLAAGAKLLGFDGITVDQELYPQEGGNTATWVWNYPGNQNTEGAVRALAKQRGQQFMAALLQGYPGIEMLAYDTFLPETWEALVQKEVNGVSTAYQANLNIDFLDGLTSVEGYSAIRLVNAVFFKTPHLYGSSWDTAMEYEYNQLYSLLSRRLSNWSYASSHVFQSPFAWIDSGHSSFEQAQSPEYVANQLAAFRRWGMGREYATFSFDGLGGFDYGPYVAGMQAASAMGVVDAEPPRLTIGANTRNGTSLALSGTADDQLAVRAVRWTSDRGGSGAATTSWRVTSGSYMTSWVAETDWGIPSIPLRAGNNRITVTVEDIKGLTTTSTVDVAG